MIPVTLLNIRIEASHPIDFGANPGSSIRGGLYEALRTMYDDGSQVQSRHDAEQNPVAWLLRLEDEETSGGINVPRPLAIRPPLQNHLPQASFGLAFYGQARQYTSLVLSAVSAMQQIGVGRGRHQFQLAGVDYVDPISHQMTPLFDELGAIQQPSLPEPPTAITIENFAKALNPEQLKVRFLTPTRIIRKNVLCHEPIFQVWFQRLLERIRLISELYTDDPVWVPFRDILAIAEDVTIVNDTTHWVEAWSTSRRDGEIRPTSGFVGDVKYAGDFATLLPWLILGQSLQVGKNTIKGCGWYQIIYQWR